VIAESEGPDAGFPIGFATERRRRKPDLNHRSPRDASFRDRICRLHSRQPKSRRERGHRAPSRDQWFESGFLQQTVSLSPAAAFEGSRTPLSARIWTAGLATGSAETRQAFYCAPTGGKISVGPYSSTAVPLRGIVTETGSEASGVSDRMSAWARSGLPPPSLPARDHPARDLALSPLHPELPR
jgi:hypothetical protein